MSSKKAIAEHTKIVFIPPQPTFILLSIKGYSRTSFHMQKISVKNNETLFRILSSN
jgi:hypothetical protein